MRKGGPREIKLERFEEALHDPTARLTYSALSGVYILLEVYFVTGRFAGVRKQSVKDIERLFNQFLVAWVNKKGYELLGTNDRITMAVRGTTSIRTKFHNIPLELPPPPGIPTYNLVAVEHSYCNPANK